MVRATPLHQVDEKKLAAVGGHIEGFGRDPRYRLGGHPMPRNHWVMRIAPETIIEKAMSPSQPASLKKQTFQPIRWQCQTERARAGVSRIVAPDDIE